MKSKPYNILPLIIVIACALLISACNKNPTEDIQTLREKSGATVEFFDEANNQVPYTMSQPGTHEINLKLVYGVSYRFFCKGTYNYDNSPLADELYSQEMSQAGTYYFTMPISLLSEIKEYTLKINITHEKQTPTIRLFFDDGDTINSDTVTKPFSLFKSYLPALQLSYNETKILPATYDIKIDGLDSSQINMPKKSGEYIINFRVIGYDNPLDNFTYSAPTKQLKLVILPATQSQILTQNSAINISETYSFETLHNGQYEFTFLDRNLSLSIYNSDLVKIYDDSVNNLKANMFLTKGIYYFYLHGASETIQTNTSLDFVPPTTNGNTITIKNTADYNIACFLPSISGNYSADTADAQLKIYDSTGLEHTSLYFEANTKYYFKISHKDDFFTLRLSRL